MAKLQRMLNMNTKLSSIDVDTDIVIIYRCDSVVEHCISSAKVVGSIPRKHTYWKNV